MTGFEGIGDFDSDDPFERYAAHQAAKGRTFGMAEVGPDEDDVGAIEGAPLVLGCPRGHGPHAEDAVFCTTCGARLELVPA